MRRSSSPVQTVLLGPGANISSARSRSSAGGNALSSTLLSALCKAGRSSFGPSPSLRSSSPRAEGTTPHCAVHHPASPPQGRRVCRRHWHDRRAVDGPECRASGVRAVGAPNEAPRKARGSACLGTPNVPRQWCYLVAAVRFTFCVLKTNIRTNSLESQLEIVTLSPYQYIYQ